MFFFVLFFSVLNVYFCASSYAHVNHGINAFKSLDSTVAPPQIRRPGGASRYDPMSYATPSSSSSVVIILSDSFPVRLTNKLKYLTKVSKIYNFSKYKSNFNQGQQMERTSHIFSRSIKSRLKCVKSTTFCIVPCSSANVS